jgi:peptide/nickel transport system permease protein
LALLTVWFITMVSFVIIQLPPGDYVNTYIMERRAMGGTVREDEAQHLRELYGLDQPLYVQYFKWVANVARGRFGWSLTFNQPVSEVIGSRLGMTMVVSLAAILLTWIVALPIGIYSAVRQYSLGDYAFTVFGFMGIAVPSFLLALIVMYLGFRWFDTDIGGMFSVEYETAPWSWDKLVDLLKHLWVPALILGLSGTASTIRIMRANLLDELRKPYVITARAKGLPERRVIMKYPVRVALNPFASTVGYLLPFVVSGAIIVALVLSLPTVGPVLLTSLKNQDMFLAGTIILMLSVMTVVGTFLSDMLLLWIDPRIRVEGR